MPELTDSQFQALKPKLEAIAQFIVQRRNAWVATWSDNSTAELENAEATELAKVIEDFQSIPKEILCAYFLAKGLNTVLGKPETSLEDLNNILLGVNSNTLKSSTFLPCYITQYAEATYGVRIHPGIIQSWLKMFHEQNHRVEMHCLKTKNGWSDSLCPPLVAQAILILQQFGIKNLVEPNASLGDLQNALVSEGLALRESETDPVFKMGALCTIIDILQQNFAELVAWYLTNNIMDQIPIGADNYKNLQKAIFDYCFTCVKPPKIISDLYKLRKRCLDVLNKLSSSPLQINFDNQKVCQWQYSITRMFKIYYQYKPLIEKPAKAPDGEECIVIIGDSASAGLGLLRPETRWVNIFRAELEHKGLKCKVINRSIAGYELGRAVEELEKFKTELPLWCGRGGRCTVLVTLSGNDALAGKSPEEISSDIEHISNMLKSKLEVTAVHWAGGLPEGLVDDDYRSSYEQIFKPKSTSEHGKMIAGPNIKPVDDPTNGVTASLLPRNILSKDNMQKDGVHPNESVQADIAAEACRALEPLLRFSLKQRRLSSLRRSHSFGELRFTVIDPNPGSASTAAVAEAAVPNVMTVVAGKEGIKAASLIANRNSSRTDVDLLALENPTVATTLNRLKVTRVYG